MRIPTIEERTKYTYKLCKYCNKEYNVSKYHVGEFVCPICEAKKIKGRRRKKSDRKRREIMQQLPVSKG